MRPMNDSSAPWATALTTRRICGVLLLLASLAVGFLPAAGQAKPGDAMGDRSAERPTVDGRSGEARTAIPSLPAAGAAPGRTLDCSDEKNKTCAECSGKVGLFCCVRKCEVVNKPKKPERPSFGRSAIGDRLPKGPSPKVAPPEPATEREIPGRIGSQDRNGADAGLPLRAPDPVVEPALPELTTSAKIWIDGRAEPLTVVSDKRPPHELRWDVSSANSANGVAILVTSSPLNGPCDSSVDLESLVAQGLPGSAFYPQTTGRTAIDFGSPAPGARLDITACGYDQTQGRRVNIGQVGNRILATSSAPLPDLFIESLRVRGDKVEFAFGNNGAGELPAGTLTYQLDRTNPELTSRRKTLTHYGSMQLASGQPRGFSDWIAVEDVAFDLSGPGDLELCINQWGQLAEQDLTNNCASRGARDVLADLVVLDAQLLLKRRAEKSLFDKSGAALSRWAPWYLLGGGDIFALTAAFVVRESADCGKVMVNCFDGPSNLGEFGHNEAVLLTIENRGNRPAPASRATIRFSATGGQVGPTFRVEVPGIDARSAVQVGIELGERQDRYSPTLRDLWDGCCTGAVKLDAGNAVAETDETNNELNLSERSRLRDRR